MTEPRPPSEPNPAPAPPPAAPEKPVRPAETREAGAGPPAGPEAIEEAGTQALAEALRSSFAIVKVVMVGLVLVFLISRFFTVDPQEKAVVLRFGKPVGEGEKALLDPGAHWAFPYPIDEVVRIPIGQVQSVPSTIGWYATTPALEAARTEPPPGESLNPATDGYVVTGDGNIVHVRGTLRYRISEPGLKYMFDFADAAEVVQNALNNALLYAAASYRVDDLLTRDVAGYREKVRQRLEQLIAQYQLGVSVDQIELQTIPPRQLKAQFEAVLQAEVRGSKALNDARSYANQTVSGARAAAEARRNSAQTERQRRVEFVAAEAKRFHDLLPAYRSNPELFLRQHQTEALQRVLARAEEKISLPERKDGKPVELRLQLNREPTRPRPVEGPADAHKH